MKASEARAKALAHVSTENIDGLYAKIMHEVNRKVEGKGEFELLDPFSLGVLGKGITNTQQNALEQRLKADGYEIVKDMGKPGYPGEVEMITIKW